MVKTPRTRHTKRHREPVTIDLEAEAVSPADDVAREEIVETADTGTSADANPQNAYVSETIEVAATPVEEPVEERVEAEAATTGASRAEPSYTFASSERESKRYSPPPPPEPPRHEGGLSTLGAGLIGAVATLAGVMALQWAGVLPTPNQPVPQELAALKSEVAALRSTAPAGLDQLRSELATLKSQVQSGNADAVAAVNAKIAELEQALAAASSNVGAEVTSKVNTLEGSVGAASEGLARADGRLSAIEGSLAQLTGRVDQQASQPKVALAIAATALKSAVDRGGPFTAELETLAAIAPNAPELEVLRSYADNGVVTVSDLDASLPSIAEAMVATATPVDPNAGFFERLTDSAASLVKVRPVGDIPGDDVGARVARMEVAIKQQAYEKAISEYDGLPDAAKAAGAGLADRIKARIAVSKLVDQLVASAMKSA